MVLQALRNGAASKSAKASIPAEDYAYLMQDNVLDLLMFCLMKRMFLERLSAVLVRAAGR